MATPFIHRIPRELDRDQAQRLAEAHAGNPFIRSANWGAVQYALDIIGKEFGLKPSAADLIVEQHVLCNVTVLVNTLAGADYEHGADSLGSLMDQAETLTETIGHYETAARSAGWTEGTQIHRVAGDEEILVADSWEDACEQDELDVTETPVLQHWAVSPWLGKHLEAMGQKIDRRFAGLTVWARTEANAFIVEDRAIQAVAATAGYPPQQAEKG